MLPTKVRFPGVPEGLIPILPSSMFIQLALEKKGKKATRIKRTQFAVTPAYAFTDYK